jgi:O-antigen/teichoic acid export membrane protein
MRRAAAYAVSVGFVGQIFLLVSGILAARLLDVQGRGDLAIAMLFPGLVALVGEIGISQGIAYHLASGRLSTKGVQSIVRRVLSVQICATVSAYFILFVWLGAGQRLLPTQWLVIGACSIPGLLANQYALGILQGLGNFALLNIVRLLPTLLYAAMLAGYALLLDASVTGVLTVWVLSLLASGVIVLAISHFAVIAVSQRTEEVAISVTLPTLIRFGLRATFGTISPLETFRLDQWAGAYLLGPGALGLYVVAQSFSNLPKIVAGSLGIVAFRVVASGISDREPLRRLTGFAVFSVSGLITVGLLLALALPWLLPALFGDSFEPSIPVGQVLIVAGTLSAVKRVIADGIRGMGSPENGTYSELIAIVVFFIVVGFFVNLWGVMGLAVAAVTAQGCSLGSSLLLAYWAVRQ